MYTLCKSFSQNCFSSSAAHTPLSSLANLCPPLISPKIRSFEQPGRYNSLPHAFSVIGKNEGLVKGLLIRGVRCNPLPRPPTTTQRLPNDHFTATQRQPDDHPTTTRRLSSPSSSCRQELRGNSGPVGVVPKECISTKRTY